MVLSSTVEGVYLLEGEGESLLLFLRGPEQQDVAGAFDKRDDTEEDERGDEQGADRVGDVPAKRLNEEGGDDHPHTAQGVGQHVQKHSCNTHQIRPPL